MSSLGPHVVLMVEPFQFWSNEVTALDNKCQPTSAERTLLANDEKRRERDSEAALREHREVADRLRREFHVSVHVVHLGAGSDEPDVIDTLKGKPDAIFPNNSISFHVPLLTSHEPPEQQLPLVVMYPMSPGRQGEIPAALLASVAKASQDHMIRVVDLRTPYQDGPQYFEGTGAMNITTDGTALFVSLSQRADRALVSVVGDVVGIPATRRFVFQATDEDGHAVYHTNVVGWVGTGICAWCFEAMAFDSVEDERAMMDYLLHNVCRGDASKMIALSRAQALNMFAGNCIELRRVVPSSCDDKVVPLLCMSTTAWNGLNEQQRDVLVDHYGTSNVARFDIPTIEHLGGGSLRCLLAASNVLPPTIESGSCRPDSVWNGKHICVLRTLFEV